MRTAFGLFERFGVELEYMIVDAETLAVRPEADRLIEAATGGIREDVPRGSMEWSNELSLHLIELKTGRPAARLAGLARSFQGEVDHINGLLAASSARLLPTAMHPWMNPAREGKLWPHGNREIYRAFDRIFNCAGHGWTNLQSTHLNLPFRTAGEFRRLHTAIRLLLPIMPALAASSPFVEGDPAPALDMRLETYRHNCRRIPSMTGRVIPDVIRTPAEYRRRILDPIYRDVAPHDPEKILREEWANARGAIARFARNTIEIRVLDIQECPRADLAIIELIVAVLGGLVANQLSPLISQEKPATSALEKVMLQCVARAGRAKIANRNLLAGLGVETRVSLTAKELWRHLLESCAPKTLPGRGDIEVMLEEGCLGERILKATGPKPSRARLKGVYRRLADCLAHGDLFHA